MSFPLTFPGNETIQVVQRTAGAASATGRRLPADDGVPVDIVATIDPVPGHILRTLPEGERATLQRIVICNDPTGLLVTGDDEVDQLPSHVFYGGWRWEVRSVARYTGGILPHVEARIMRVEQD